MRFSISFVTALLAASSECMPLKDVMTVSDVANDLAQVTETNDGLLRPTQEEFLKFSQLGFFDTTLEGNADNIDPEIFEKFKERRNENANGNGKGKGNAAAEIEETEVVVSPVLFA